MLEDHHEGRWRVSESEPETCPWCERYTTRHMDAYYYGFEPTGVEAIDNILCSVATAGKGAHHTESWNEYGYPALIQKAANIAAEQLRRSPPAPAIDVEAVVRAVLDAYEMGPSFTEDAIRAALGGKEQQ